jgi:hypothetical protein
VIGSGEAAACLSVSENLCSTPCLENRPPWRGLGGPQDDMALLNNLILACEAFCRSPAGKTIAGWCHALPR